MILWTPSTSDPLAVICEQFASASWLLLGKLRMNLRIGHILRGSHEEPKEEK